MAPDVAPDVMAVDVVSKPASGLDATSYVIELASSFRRGWQPWLAAVGRLAAGLDAAGETQQDAARSNWLVVSVVSRTASH